MTELIFASGNKGKIKEVKEIFADTDYEIHSLYDFGEPPEIEETGTTFEENAFIKAKTIFDKFNKPVIADDSGLSVVQLKGAPGVYSARYAGENCTYDDNNNKLIRELSSYPEPHKAEFVCCAVLYDGNSGITAFGKLPGIIIDEFRGEHGFGYDPIFVPDGYEKTLAQMNLQQKNGISHRSKAFNNLKEKLKSKEN